MFVYTPGGRDILGVSDSQMQSELASSLVTANEAMVNSDVDLQFSLVRVEPVSVQWNYIIPRACSIILVISISSPSQGNPIDNGVVGLTPLSYRHPACCCKINVISSR